MKIFGQKTEAVWEQVADKNIWTFHSVLVYGILFWGMSSSSLKLYKLQKRVVCIMMDQGNRTSCRELFKKLEILPLKSQYIFSILLFVVKNEKHFITNYDNHNVETRQCENLHLPHMRLTLCQNGVHFNGIRIYNKLPLYLNELVESPQIFKRILKKYLVSHCFYSLDEFYDLIV
jgi:hypothetical protein